MIAMYMQAHDAARYEALKSPCVGPTGDFAPRIEVSRHAWRLRCQRTSRQKTTPTARLEKTLTRRVISQHVSLFT